MAAVAIPTAVAIATAALLTTIVAVAHRLGLLAWVWRRRHVPAAGARVPVIAAIATANPPTTTTPNDFLAVVSGGVAARQGVRRPITSPPAV